MKKLMAVALVLIASLLSFSAHAGNEFRVAWSHYTGWEPWAYADQQGILKKWADKYGIKIKLTLVNDYIESINLYTSGQFDACVMTNMDALTIPATGGVDSTVLIVGDYSNGNDGIVMRNATNVKELKGKNVLLVELSVSHYLLARALGMNGMTERDVKVVNTSDADIASVFLAQPDAAVVTWNPPLQQVRQVKGASLLFDSSKVPGEILDLMVVKTNSDERLKKALTGAWYEAMAAMSGGGATQKKAIGVMAQTAGGTEAEFNAQLKTTQMFYKPADAVKIATDAKLVETMEQVRHFSFEKGLFGAGAKSVDYVGMSFPGGRTLGDNKNIKLRFDATYMELARDGKL